ncbi:hypothetical protein CEUSTIGMA_g11932.t1 [Chlamydomonas eustigma]|uniref:mRNA cap-binding protein n=1 Tax=Chlamydomonas eustigma TaxID=1157962 RepID=A0A250XNN2_9CHLO|nr:hypothetical protein CEUSTIGMA_g11932.t1 [Chlamydomonas eustigma]|eukprot:GAX84512.1 hypothetical protein CEUSTIGMA_g11932.t1 [Chlamydomonas eustigma]
MDKSQSSTAIRLFMILLAAAVLFGLVAYYNSVKSGNERFGSGDGVGYTGPGTNASNMTSFGINDPSQIDPAVGPVQPSGGFSTANAASFVATPSPQPIEPIGNEKYLPVGMNEGGGVPVDPFPQDRTKPDELLPRDAVNTKWAQANPAGQGDIGDQNLLTSGYHLGFDTQGNSLRNASLDLRSEPSNPRNNAPMNGVLENVDNAASKLWRHIGTCAAVCLVVALVLWYVASAVLALWTEWWQNQIPSFSAKVSGVSASSDDVAYPPSQDEAQQTTPLATAVGATLAKTTALYGPYNAAMKRFAASRNETADDLVGSQILSRSDDDYLYPRRGSPLMRFRPSTDADDVSPMAQAQPGAPGRVRRRCPPAALLLLVPVPGRGRGPGRTALRPVHADDGPHGRGVQAREPVVVPFADAGRQGARGLVRPRALQPGACEVPGVSAALHGTGRDPAAAAAKRPAEGRGRRGAAADLALFLGPPLRTVRRPGEVRVVGARQGSGLGRARGRGVRRYRAGPLASSRFRARAGAGTRPDAVVPELFSVSRQTMLSERVRADLERNSSSRNSSWTTGEVLACADRTMRSALIDASCAEHRLLTAGSIGGDAFKSALLRADEAIATAYAHRAFARERGTDAVIDRRSSLGEEISSLLSSRPRTPQVTSGHTLNKTMGEDSGVPVDECNCCLQDVWTTYFHDPADPKWTLDSYVRLADAATVQDAMEICRSLHDLVSRGMFFMMREHVFPCWDDSHNIDGGCLSIKVPAEHAADAWALMVKRAVGETMAIDANAWSLVNGISISPKRGFCILKVWTSDANMCGREHFRIPEDYRGEVVFRSNRENISSGR